MRNILELHRRATDIVRVIVDKVRDEDLGRPTPCAGWDLRTLLAHMVGQDYGFAAAALADVGEEVFAPRDIAKHAIGAELVVAAFAAADPAREVLQPEFHQRFPLATVVGFHLLDTAVHGWDVAVSIGLDVDYDDELVSAVEAQAERVPDGEIRTGPDAVFGPVLPVGGTAGWARTLRLLGRDPGWVAPRVQ
jgi:uncharacterized protein (TIGR03086 family)